MAGANQEDNSKWHLGDALADDPSSGNLVDFHFTQEKVIPFTVVEALWMGV